MMNLTEILNVKFYGSQNPSIFNHLRQALKGTKWVDMTLRIKIKTNQKWCEGIYTLRIKLFF